MEIIGKTVLTEKIAKKLDVSKKMAKDFIDVFCDEVMTEVAENGKVTIIGFGTFEKKDFNCLNPSTKKPMKTKTVRFRAGETFKKTVKNKK